MTDTIPERSNVAELTSYTGSDGHSYTAGTDGNLHDDDGHVITEVRHVSTADLPRSDDGYIPETTQVRIYLLTCGHVQWGLDHGIDDWDRESMACKACAAHVGIRHYITENAINLYG